MRRIQNFKSSRSGRDNERGAALISVLLISTLLLTAGGILILTTSMSAINPIDAQAEMQAFYAAEAGLQRTLNVMRTKDIPAGTMPAGKTKLSTREVVLNPRLANWLPYDGPVINGASTTLVGTNAFSVLITDPDDPDSAKINASALYKPSRVFVQLTAYGPKRARKILNMIVLRWDLHGFQAPATITLRGSDATPNPPSLTLDTGASAATVYTGNDSAGGASISALAVTASDVPPAQDGIKRDDQIEGSPISVLGTTSPYAGVPAAPQPEWLDTADKARAFLSMLQAEASSQNRYFTTQPAASQMGVAGNPKLTFINGDADLGSGDQGTGLLIVTGKLTMGGNTSFKGLILVLGKGSVERSGSGNGVISGGIVVAKFGATGGFEAPSFTTKGGGNARIEYNSNDASEGTSTVPEYQVIGVVEK
jgi:hypothetical protein